jgi:hypothetical protein
MNGVSVVQIMGFWDVITMLFGRVCTKDSGGNLLSPASR